MQELFAGFVAAILLRASSASVGTRRPSQAALSTLARYRFSSVCTRFSDATPASNRVNCFSISATMRCLFVGWRKRNVQFFEEDGRNA